VPLTQEEVGQAVGQGRQLVAAAGPGSQVQYKLPGGAIQIGSPYNLAAIGPDEYPTPEAAAAAASQRPGYTVIPSGRGTFLLAPPPTKEQLLPPPPGTPGATLPPPPGAPRTPSAPPRATIAPNAFVAGMMQRGWTPAEAQAAAGNVSSESGFNSAAVKPTGGDSGLLQWTGARLQGLQNYAAATGRNWHDPQAQMDWLHLERTGDSTKYGGTDERGSFAKAFIGGTAADQAERFANFVERPAADTAHIAARRWAADQYAPPTQVAAAPTAPAVAPSAPTAVAPPSAPWRPFTAATAEAAEIPPGAVAATPAPAPAAPAPAPAPTPPAGPARDAVIPHTVVPATPPAPEGAAFPPAAPPVARVPPAALTVPVVPPRVPTPAPVTPAAGAGQLPPPAPGARDVPVGPQGQPLDTTSQEYQGGLTQTSKVPDANNAEARAALNYAGITNLETASPAQIVRYYELNRALQAQQKLDAADIARTQKAVLEGDGTAVVSLMQGRNAVNRFLTDFPNPATRAYYVGTLRYPIDALKQAVSADPQVAKFHTELGAISAPTEGSGWIGRMLGLPGGSPLMGGEQDTLKKTLPSGATDSADFEQRLQTYADTLDSSIAFRDFLRGKTAADVTVPQVNQFLLDYNAARTQQRLSAFQPPPAATAPPASAPAAAAPPAWQPTAVW
jgi:Phage tail lysozyme